MRILHKNLRDNSLLDLLAELRLRNFLHLHQDHGGDLLWAESLLLTKVLDLDERSTILLNNGERPVSHVLLFCVSAPSEIFVGYAANLLDIRVTLGGKSVLKCHGSAKRVLTRNDGQSDA